MFSYIINYSFFFSVNMLKTIFTMNHFCYYFRNLFSNYKEVVAMKINIGKFGFWLPMIMFVKSIDDAEISYPLQQYRAWCSNLCFCSAFPLALNEPSPSTHFTEPLTSAWIPESVASPLRGSWYWGNWVSSTFPLDVRETRKDLSWWYWPYDHSIFTDG